MLKYSEGFRNGLCVTGSMKGLLDLCFIRIYSGAVPTSPNDTLGSAVLLVEINAGAGVGGTFEATATGGTLSKKASETWNGTCAASGTATFYRLVKSGDSGAGSTTAVRIQGTVAVAGADLNLTNPALVSGAVQSLNYYYLTLPES